MKIHYLDCDGKKKLFSFHRHDYKSWEDENKLYILDGGFDYIKTSHHGTIVYSDIQDVIEDIREQFEWGQNEDGKGNYIEKTIYRLLKDISDSHLKNLIKYVKRNPVYKEIFKAEQKYRKENDIKIDDYD